MLRAIERRKPIVPLRIAAVGLPLYIQEKQPVEARRDDDETLRVLTEALSTAWRECRACSPGEEAPAVGAEIPHGPVTLQRQRELAYLKDLLYRNYSDREDRYVPLEGKERQSPSLARSLKGLRMDTDAVLRAFGQDGLAPEPSREKTYPDVLDAYRDLRQRPIRRLAVLGEPGAGKTFPWSASPSSTPSVR
jgi:hypothetical protein